jgi:hypothetical protein
MQSDVAREFSPKGCTSIQPKILVGFATWARKVQPSDCKQQLLIIHLSTSSN